MVSKVGDRRILVYRKRPNDIADSCYRLTFPSPIPMPVGTPIHDQRWTLRQIGIYHHHDPDELQNLWIFFHAGPDTPIQRELEKYPALLGRGLRPDQAWFTLHSFIFSSHLSDWHSYVSHLGHNVDRYVSVSNHPC
jgi:hypothetical protein